MKNQIEKIWKSYVSKLMYNKDLNVSDTTFDNVDQIFGVPWLFIDEGWITVAKYLVIYGEEKAIKYYLLG